MHQESKTKLVNTSCWVADEVQSQVWRTEEAQKEEAEGSTSSELRQMMSNEEKGGVSKQSGERSMVVPEITSVFKVKMTIQHLDGSWYLIC